MVTQNSWSIYLEFEFKPVRFVRQEPSGREWWVLHTEYKVHSCLVTEVVTEMKSRKRTRSRRTTKEEQQGGRGGGGTYQRGSPCVL